MEPMTRVNRARIALYLVALANIVLVAVDWPHPSKLTEIATMIVCGGWVMLAYREDPARFHRRVSHAEAVKMILAPVIFVGVIVGLAETHLL
jgi:hypothetical protein